MSRRAALLPSALAAAVPRSRCERCRRLATSYYNHPLAAYSSISSFSTSLLSSAPPRRSYAASAAPSGGILSGLTQRLTGVMDERRAVAADNKFSAMVGDMLAVPKYTLQEHLRFMEQTAADAGVSGWKSYMPGVSSQAGVEELKRMLNILQAFTPSERADLNLINRDSRLRVAAGTGRTVADVNFVLRQFSGGAMVHQWLQSRKARGLPLPTTQGELSSMMAVDKPPQAQQIKHKPRRR